MSYNPNIPQSNTLVSLSQKYFKTNFTIINRCFGSDPINEDGPGDHVSLTHIDETKLGKHKKTSFLVQIADPAPAANECDLYSKAVNDIPELHYIRNGDLAGYQLTDTGGLSVGGLVLRAAVVFGQSGEIIKVPGVDNEGNAIEVPLSFNVDSVTPNDGKVGEEYRPDYTINFSKTLGTADYVWVIQSFNKPRSTSQTKLPRAQMQPYNSGTYGSVVTATSFRLNGYVFATSGISPNPRNRSHGRFVRMMFQAYTVTQ